MQSPITENQIHRHPECSKDPDLDGYFHEPIKKVKKTLSIEIVDSFYEKDASKKYNQSPNNAASNRIGHFGLLTSQTTPRCISIASPRVCSEYALRVDAEDPEKLQIETKYDDFYFESDFFDVSMQKCNRKIMEDRVTHTILHLFEQYHRLYLNQIRLIAQRADFLGFSMATHPRLFQSSLRKIFTNSLQTTVSF